MEIVHVCKEIARKHQKEGRSGRRIEERGKWRRYRHDR
jgi:hypothetical protein